MTSPRMGRLIDIFTRTENIEGTNENKKELMEYLHDWVQTEQEDKSRRLTLGKNKWNYSLAHNLQKHKLENHTKVKSKE